MRASVYIDDTGISNQKTKSRFCNPTRKSFVAVIFDKNEKYEAEYQIKDCIDNVLKELNVNEFHSSDIYQGQKQYKHISKETRFGILKALSVIYKHYKWPIIIQTVDNNFHKRNNI